MQISDILDNTKLKRQKKHRQIVAIIRFDIVQVCY